MAVEDQLKKRNSAAPSGCGAVGSSGFVTDSTEAAVVATLLTAAMN